MRLAIAALALVALAGCSQSNDDNPPPEAAAVPAKEDARLISYLNEKYLDVAPIQYRAGRIDLDGDGTDEVLAYVGGSLVCGSGGCPLLVLKDDGTTFTPIAETSVTRLPVGVLDTTTNGMKDLWVTVGGGGGESGLRKLSFDGKSYPANPTVDGNGVEKLDKPGTEIIADGDLLKVD
jgi:hypothetical protein